MVGSKKADPVVSIAPTAVPANTQVASVAPTTDNTASHTNVPTLVPAITATPTAAEMAMSSHKESTDESVFLTMYNDWFGTQETRYEFAGVVETGSVTEQELPSAYLHAYNVIYEDDWTLSYFVPVDGEGNELPFVYTQEADYLTIVYPEEYATAPEEPADDYYAASETKSYSEFTADEYVACGKDLLLKYLRYPESVRWQQSGVHSTDGYGRALVVIYCMAKNIYGGTSAECYWVCIEMNQDGTYSYNSEMPYCLGDTMDILAIRNLNNWGSPR